MTRPAGSIRLRLMTGKAAADRVPEQNAGTATTYTYNTDDTIYSVSDARGASAAYSYNGRHLVTGITYSAPTGSGITVPTPVGYGYDAAGNRISMSDGTNSCSYNYDQLSRVMTETRHLNDLAGSASGNYAISYQYNLAGELSGITDPSGAQVGYDYDQIGRLQSMS